MMATRFLKPSARVIGSRLIIRPSLPTYTRRFQTTISERLRSTTATENTPLTQIYYHPFTSPPPIDKNNPKSEYYAISFLETPPKNLNDDSTVLGVLPIGGSLESFKTNPLFVNLLHDAVKAVLQEGSDEAIVAEAKQLGNGWMHIHDSRNVPALGRIGDPEDIIGSVRVEDGKILAETYQPMPTYRVCTNDGLPQLSPGLARKLEQILLERSSK